MDPRFHALVSLAHAAFCDDIACHAGADGDHRDGMDNDDYHDLKLTLAEAADAFFGVDFDSA